MADLRRRFEFLPQTKSRALARSGLDSAANQRSRFSGSLPVSDHRPRSLEVVALGASIPGTFLPLFLHPASPALILSD